MKIFKKIYFSTTWIWGKNCELKMTKNRDQLDSMNSIIFASFPNMFIQNRNIHKTECAQMMHLSIKSIKVHWGKYTKQHHEKTSVFELPPSSRKTKETWLPICFWFSFFIFNFIRFIFQILNGFNFTIW